jgi:polyisoprenoid-binding protein YceI
MRKFSVLLLAAAALSGLPAAIHAQGNPSAAVAEGGAFKVESSHTRVGFGVNHMGFTEYYGEFSGVSGGLSINPRNIAATKLEITLPIDSVSTTNAKLDGEIKSAMFLDAGQFPQARFVATKVVSTGAGTATITGDLTLHGQTHPVTLKASFVGGGANPMNKAYTLGFNATGSFKRSDFGVKTYVPMVSDEVTLRISAAFERE